MKDPFFSVVIPTFNRSDIILESVNSVLAQTFKDFEVIVVDDGSTDSTQLSISTIADERVRYVYQKNTGPAQARNTGAANARGQFIIFLDSDDSFTRQYLAKLHEELSKKEYHLGLGYARYIDDNGVEIAFVAPQKSKEPVGPQLAGAFAISKKVFQAIHGYDKNLSYSENTELFVRLKLENKLVEDLICTVPDEGVVVNFRDSRDRFHSYSALKYKSTGYFLEKHKAYFSKYLDLYVLYKSIYAIGAFQNGDIAAAKRSVLDVIVKKPFRIKSYFQYLLFNFPFFARLYWKQSKK